MYRQVIVEIDNDVWPTRTQLLNVDGVVYYISNGIYHTDKDKKFPVRYIEHKLWLEKRDIKFIWTGKYYLFHTTDDAMQFKLVWK